MLLHLRWRAVPLLLPLALLAATPALLVWGAALAQSIGLGHLLDNLPMPARAGTRLERLVLLGTFWAVTMGGPLAAVALGLLAIVDAELRVDAWELSARVRLPAPPWRWREVLAMLLLGLGARTFGAEAGILSVVAHDRALVCILNSAARPLRAHTCVQTQ